MGQRSCNNKPWPGSTRLWLKGTAGLDGVQAEAEGKRSKKEKVNIRMLLWLLYELDSNTPM